MLRGQLDIRRIVSILTARVAPWRWYEIRARLWKHANRSFLQRFAPIQ